MKGSVVDSTNSQKDSQAIIYVGENTLVYGTSHISNAKLIKIEKTIVSKKTVEPKNQNVTLKGRLVASKENQSQELKLLQQKIAKKSKNNFYTSSHDSNLVSFGKVKFACLATIDSLSFKYNKAFISAENSLNNFKLQKPPQKFFTSLFYSEFFKFRNSFLRGPPYFV